MALYHAGKAASLAHANYIHEFFVGENIHQNFSADFESVAITRCSFAFRRLRFSCRRFGTVLHGDFAHELYRWQVMLAEMSLHGLGYILALHELHQADLRGFIAIFVVALDLRDHAWASLKDGDRMNVTLVVKHLRHADFLA